MGNIHGSANIFKGGSVHPHRRGEHEKDVQIIPVGDGSSPQAWGTFFQSFSIVSRKRFIPTGVGNIPTPLPGGQHYAVHPHRRGEHHGPIVTPSVGFGSSPQAWGTFQEDQIIFKTGRFIPTGVGNICYLSIHFKMISVHPHRRGEHRLLVSPMIWASGSSPQAWGTSHVHNVQPIGERFIPTGVGNIAHYDGRCPEFAVHPHRRGEHEIVFKVIEKGSGSSPQAWGTYE